MELSQTITEQIVEAHSEVIAAASAALSHAKRAGELLAEVKAGLPHGEWLPWLSANVPFSERTAQNYMRIASRWAEIENTQGAADLSIEGALRLLTGLKTHPYCDLFPVDEEVIETIAKSLRNNGGKLYMPITLFEGRILDGKLRYEACKRAGVEPTFNTYPDDYPQLRGSALDFVMASNATGRSLSESQRAVIAVELEPMLAALEALKTAKEGMSRGHSAEQLAEIIEISQEAEQLASGINLDTLRELGKYAKS